MNKTELVAAIAERAELSKKDSEKALKAFVDVVAEELKNDTSAIEIPVCVGYGPAIHIAVPDDGDYTIEARFNPPRIWTFLRSIYPWCISLLFSLTCFLAIVSHYHTKRHIPSTTS